ncbi:hypothetical protein GCM10025866_04810 [Naasia aerilata]|uniref:Xaa-Pro aminopeptidase n=1 Tax=Naasia aerilata TaxID=1162966 RepID=A0ABN6XI30_9MICO|nr:hypothetical protein GCM10025866_04810 [Naasia aerilata]
MNDESERVADLEAPEATGPVREAEEVPTQRIVPEEVVPDGAASGDAAPTGSTGPAPRATTNRAAGFPDSFGAYIGSGWADRVLVTPPQRDQAPYAAERRRRLSELFPGQRLVIRAGDRKVRSNDTDYPFRADSGFSWLTGWGADSEPGAVLVLEPTGDAHTATLYFRPAAGRDSDEFYANPEIGEFWIGPRPTLEHVAADLGLATAPLARFTSADDDLDADTSEELARALSEFRLVKDEYEIGQMRLAVEATALGFDDVVADFPRVQQHERGERIVEGFSTRGPARTATRSATTRSPHPALTRASCTGRATTARSSPATSSSSTRASSCRASTRPTSRGRSRSTAASRRPSGSSTRRCARPPTPPSRL